MRNWQHFAWTSGDHTCEQQAHSFHVVYWLLGRPPVSAVGMGGRQVCKGAKYGDVFDHHYTEFTYDDGLQLFAQDRQISGCWNDMSEWVHGSDGNVRAAAVPRRDDRRCQPLVDSVTAATTPTSSSTTHLSTPSVTTNPTTRANWRHELHDVGDGPYGHVFRRRGDVGESSQFTAPAGAGDLHVGVRNHPCFPARTAPMSMRCPSRASPNPMDRQRSFDANGRKCSTT